MFWLVILCIILLISLLMLCIKLYLLYKSMDEVQTELENGLEHDSNILLTISSRDRHFRKFVNHLNRQLKVYHKQRNQYQSGNNELENAVTNISHDLRTPLTAIRGYMDLLQKEPHSDNVRRYLEIIDNRTKALEGLTEELFRYSVASSSKEELHFEMTNINAVLEESIAAYYPVFMGRGIQPNITMTEQIIERELDRDALMRVFANILSNATKYSDGDMKIDLEDNGTITFTNSATNLKQTDIQKLFDRFYTVETSRNSTGLGLAIAKTLIEKMKGFIGVDYVDGKLKIIIEFKESNWP